MDDGGEIEAGRRARLLAHLREVARERDPDRASAGHAYVADCMRRALARSGKPAAHAFQHRGRTHENIVLDLPGRGGDGLVLVGAHYDGVPGSFGADDNGSALAVLLELAPAFAAEPPPRPLRRVPFALERPARVG